MNDWISELPTSRPVISLVYVGGGWWWWSTGPRRLFTRIPVPRAPVTFSGLMSRRPIRPVRRESRGPSWRRPASRRRAATRRGGG